MPFDPTLLAFWAKKLIAVLILPPAAPLVLIGLGLLFSRLRKLAWLGWLYAMATSVPMAVAWLATPLEPSGPAALDQVRGTGAIVILGAGVRSHAPEMGGPTVSALALERLRYGARLARETGLPILVSGGAPQDDIVEAHLMREVLEQEFQVPVRWMEDASLDTRDNARRSARLLRAAGIERVTLVTHAAHMRRAQAAFEAAGLRVTPAPTVWISGGEGDASWSDVVPTPRGAYEGWYAVHEWVGGLAYRVSESSAPPPAISRHSERAIQPSTSTPATSEPQSNH